MASIITRGIARVIGEVLGAHYYSHRRIESLCHESGLSGDPPQGNCSDKLTYWICREADSNPDKILTIVGVLICEYMELEHQSAAEGQKRLKNILAAEHLSYSRGGHIFGSAVSVPARLLDDLLRKKAIPEIETEFRRALESVESDPPAALTAACSILESFCRI